MIYSDFCDMFDELNLFALVNGCVERSGINLSVTGPSGAIETVGLYVTSL